MQIIQSIREKGAAIVIGVIALSLISFILMDAKQGGSKLFGSYSTSVGKINGKEIELSEFNKKVKDAEDMQFQRTGQRPSGTQSYQMREQTWNQIVAETVFFAEAEKLGIDFTSKELAAVLLSNDPSNPFLQEQGLKDSVTGQLDINKAKTAITNIKKLKGEQRDALNTQMIDPLKLNKIVSKYTGLLNASAYYPSWMQKSDEEDRNKFATISYVTIPYSEISDSTIKVTDQDINDYVAKNKGLFKQEDAGRRISYVTFSQLPNGEDSAKTFTLVSDLKTSFMSDSNTKAFIARNLSVIDFKDDYATKEKISPMVADTLVKLANGAVYGPYAEKNNYVLAKMISSKQLPDSVKARHILISTQDGKLSDSTAKKLADSIYNAINTGADFSQLAMKYSADGSKDKGGDLGTFSYGTMVPEFNDFCFNKSTGSKGVVKTQFGYHIIEVMNQKDFKTAYKIAYMAKEIIASDVTINKSSIDATKASASKSKSELEKYAAKNGLSLTTVPTMLKENDYSVGALQDARSLVRWAFEAKVGDVSESFSIGDQFVVAVLDKVVEKGLQDAETARPGCEAIIRNKKKAEQIIKKIGNNPSLETAAGIYKKSIVTVGTDSSITFNSQIINGLGMEAKVIGAAFNEEFKNKPSKPFEGTTGVFVVKVNGVQNKNTETTEEAKQQANQKLSAIRSQSNSWFEGLRKQADIVDNRSKHF